MTALSPGARVRAHLPEYGAEALGLGLFMLSAAAFTVLLYHPASPMLRLLPAELPRRVLVGAAMGATALLNVHAPWGRRSGAHLNPAFTLAMTRLGRVHPADAVAYAVSQFAGGIAGIAVAAVLLAPWIGHPSVRYVVTVPGRAGLLAAFAGEFVISALLMAAVLACLAAPRWQRRTPVVVALLIACYISVESPLSGMSMNPARTLGSAVAAGDFSALWLYFTAPVLGMLLPAALVDRHRAFCAKVLHDEARPCLFCDFRRAARHGNPAPAAVVQHAGRRTR